MRNSVKLGQTFESKKFNYQNKNNSASSKGLNIELFWDRKGCSYVFKVVKFLGDDATIALLPNSTVRFFSREWNSQFFCWEWNEINEDEADYFSMILVNEEFWCFAPSFFDLEPKSPSHILDFEDMEQIENQLLAQAS
jgi:hypothetical protein